MFELAKRFNTNDPRKKPSFTKFRLNICSDQAELEKDGSNEATKGVWAEQAQFLQFSSDDPNLLVSNHRVELMPDGHVRLYSEHFTRYWRFHNDWIWASTLTPSVNDINLLFWPVKIDNNTIALRSMGNNSKPQSARSNTPPPTHSIPNSQKKEHETWETVLKVFVIKAAYFLITVLF
ncbi:hypothetical protein AAHA92_04867 [Salvia divinorum]|uniref:Agglutinin domain-containing protein n=1 Tax=Salvia divinorum TaxID=28513 RepID=A0ABD1I1L0_SALDI